MEPTLGWTLLSRDALRRAETQLRDDVQGVRDVLVGLARGDRPQNIELAV